jgi:hypothetical protein
MYSFFRYFEVSLFFMMPWIVEPNKTIRSTTRIHLQSVAGRTRRSLSGNSESSTNCHIFSRGD